MNAAWIFLAVAALPALTQPIGSACGSSSAAISITATSSRSPGRGSAARFAGILSAEHPPGDRGRRSLDGEGRRGPLRARTASPKRWDPTQLPPQTDEPKAS